jgi:hypothetical protein
MQPAFLPWAGFFNLMSQVDDFVFLDDVQLEKQSWQTRNRLLFGKAVHWVSVPVRHESLNQTIADTVVVESSPWREKLARSFSQNYGRHPHYAEAKEVMDVIRRSKGLRLGDMNVAVIRLIAERLKLAPRFHRTGELNIAGARSKRLAVLCKHFNADEYLSPVGAAEYLAEDNFKEISQITLRFQDYNPQAYTQKHAGEFMSHLSILDVVANLGWGLTREYVLQGYVR